MVAGSGGLLIASRLLVTCVHIVLQIAPVNFLRFWVETVDEVFGVGVTVVVEVATGVAWVVWIQAILLLPIVGHSVTIGIFVRCAFVFRIATDLRRMSDESQRNQADDFSNGFLGISDVGEIRFDVGAG